MVLHIIVGIRVAGEAIVLWGWITLMLFITDMLVYGTVMLNGMDSA